MPRYGTQTLNFIIVGTAGNFRHDTVTRLENDTK